MSKSVKSMTNIAAIATIYVVVSLFLNVLSFGPIQIRIAEVLIIAAIVSVDGIYGVSLGCFFTNLIGSSLGFSPLGIMAKEEIVNAIALIFWLSEIAKKSF